LLASQEDSLLEKPIESVYDFIKQQGKGFIHPPAAEAAAARTIIFDDARLSRV